MYQYGDPITTQWVSVVGSGDRFEAHDKKEQGMVRSRNGSVELQ
jgi:hypothetical protein